MESPIGSGAAEGQRMSTKRPTNAAAPQQRRFFFGMSISRSGGVPTHRIAHRIAAQAGREHLMALRGLWALHRERGE